MNEQIKELWSQAGGHYDSGNQHTWPQYTIDDPEKFVELIIQQCVQACINEGKTYVMKSAGEYASNLYATAIKKHFGVEEQVTESNEWHTCPYAEEIHGDYETLCDCDEEQAYQCRMDI